LYGTFETASFIINACHSFSFNFSFNAIQFLFFVLDSIYTERYLNLPVLNPGGYVNASVSNVTAFDKVDYLLAHGSGDDNVHFANSAHLLDMFTKAQIRKFRFRMFTDRFESRSRVNKSNEALTNQLHSDHSIRMRGANEELFEYLTNFLIEKWGKGGRRRG